MFYSNKFITVPAFYANADPHLGHLYSATLGDVSRRWELLKNDENRVKNMAEKIAGKPSIFSVGLDEHGSKIEAAARLAGMEPQQHCDVYYKNFEKMFKTFNISYTHFVRTSQESHKTAVNHFWRKLQSTGSIYKDNYEGWYSTVDECFYGDKEVDCVTDEATGTQQHVAIETKSSVTFVKEQNYMFDYKS
uniref:Methionyl/Leucyl tRNA synthetase domain-containing protein n=1 Tax=Ditylenchus dipsaci TaxID=166011 RepID=A0A915EQM0_9BILA